MCTWGGTMCAYVLRCADRGGIADPGACARTKTKRGPGGHVRDVQRNAFSQIHSRRIARTSPPSSGARPPGVDLGRRNTLKVAHMLPVSAQDFRSCTCPRIRDAPRIRTPKDMCAHGTPHVPIEFFCAPMGYHVRPGRTRKSHVRTRRAHPAMCAQKCHARNTPQDLPHDDRHLDICWLQRSRVKIVQTVSEMLKKVLEKRDE
jgi:hypothetical protein